jgi:hypothetical protein
VPAFFIPSAWSTHAIPIMGDLVCRKMPWPTH